MVQRLIVPVDGSPASWRAVEHAAVLGRKCAAPIDVVQVVLASGEQADAERRLADGARDLTDSTGVPIENHVLLAGDTVGAALAGVIERHPESTIVMSSHGRGRSAAVLGSVTEELLHREFGPLVVIGPNVEAATFEGPILATVDGSDRSEQALPLAAAWGIELGLTPWIVEVVEPVHVSSEHLRESSYPARLARHLSEASKHRVEFEVLHGTHPAGAIEVFAEQLGASLIVATTHGRTGLSRLRIGSTAAAIVRHAPCPVLLVRPPDLAANTSATGGSDAVMH